MTSIINRLRAHSIYAFATLATLLSGGAFAQSDKVNQLNMSPGVTSAGQAILRLTHGNFVDLCRYWCVGFWRDVLLHHLPSKIARVQGFEFS
jgi:hypothetical protein